MREERGKPDPSLLFNLARSAFGLELLGPCDLLRAADIDRNALVNAAGDNFERTPMSSRGCAAGLLGHHRKRRDLVHQAQLAGAPAAGAHLARVKEDSAVEQTAMEVANEGAAVA